MPQEPHIYANVNLKVTDEERWQFKEWCVRHRMSQVDAFRLGFRLLQDHAAALTLPTAEPVKEKNLE